MSISVYPALMGFSVPIALATVLAVAIVGAVLYRLARTRAHRQVARAIPCSPVAAKAGWRAMHGGDKPNRRFLKPEQIEPILSKLPQDWTSVDAPDNVASALGIRSPKDVAHGISGVLDPRGSKPMYGYDALAGITKIRFEQDPDRSRGEEDANVDHYIITRCLSPKGYWLIGPFHKHADLKANARIEAWPDYAAVGDFAGVLVVEFKDLPPAPRAEA